MNRILFENWERLQVREDGDCFMVVRPDFVDLQNSPAVFYQRGTWQYEIIREWRNATPLCHLPLTELGEIMYSLYRDGAK